MADEDDFAAFLADIEQAHEGETTTTTSEEPVVGSKRERGES